MVMYDKMIVNVGQADRQLVTFGAVRWFNNIKSLVVKQCVMTGKKS